MYIRELSLKEFENFTKDNDYNTYHQTLNYAIFKASNDYEYEIIGYVDDENEIHAAALILVKLVDGYLYGYMPQGPIIDFSNETLVKNFTSDLIKFYKKENISFIRVNPPIIVSEIDRVTHERKYSNNSNLVSNLIRAGWQKQDENQYFEAILPRVTAIVDLDEYDFKKLNKNTRNKINRGKRKGLNLEIGTSDKLNYLYEFTKRKTKKKEFYFSDYYNAFAKSDKADLFLVSINYDDLLKNSQTAYEKESKRNAYLKDKVISKPGTRNINKKMNSDKSLLSYKEDIALGSKYVMENKKTYIAAALVIKHGNMINIRISGYDKTYASFAPNYFLYNEILKFYHHDYKYADLNGLTGDLSHNCKYYGLNEFKLGFNPHICEFAGEFDLVLNKYTYHKLISKGILEKDLNENK